MELNEEEACKRAGEEHFIKAFLKCLQENRLISPKDVAIVLNFCHVEIPEEILLYAKSIENNKIARWRFVRVMDIDCKSAFDDLATPMMLQEEYKEIRKELKEKNEKVRREDVLIAMGKRYNMSPEKLSQLMYRKKIKRKAPRNPIPY